MPKIFSPGIASNLTFRPDSSPPTIPFHSRLVILRQRLSFETVPS